MREFDMLTKKESVHTYADVKPTNISPIDYTDVSFGDVAVNWDVITTIPALYWMKDRKVTETYKSFEEKQEDDVIVTNRPGMAFDIETTNITEYKAAKRKGRVTNKMESSRSYMYHWQFGIDDYIIHGNKWEQFLALLEMIRVNNTPILNDAIKMVTVWIANEGYEFQFMRKQLEMAGWNCCSMFAKECRKPLTSVFCKDGFYFVFRDALAISNSSLGKLSKLYNLPTSKTHDLDYKVKRNSQTVLTPAELNYCSCDIRVLIEFHEWLYENYVSHGLPIQQTATGHVRHDEKYYFNLFESEKVIKVKNCKSKTFTNWSSFVRHTLPAMFPETRDEYDELMTKCFAGGFTHANAAYAGVTIGTTDDAVIKASVNGGDFTSSYPYVVMFQKFPMKPFRSDDRIVSLDQIDGKFPAIIKVKLYGLMATTMHSTISISKTYEYDECGKDSADTADMINAIVDNGRIVSADFLTLMITDVDLLENLKKFYTWEDEEIIDCKTSILYDSLPDYVRFNQARYYGKKCALKKQGLDGTSEYNIAKAGANSNYGLMCQKQNIAEVEYNGEWSETDTSKLTLDEVNELYRNGIFNSRGDIKCVNSPYWAIWITSHARGNLFKLLSAIGNDALYCDTDSIYYMNPDRYQDIVNDYNKAIYANNKAIIDAWNAAHDDEFQLDYELFRDLGEFDKLNKNGDYIRFKTLGAKRYLKEGPNKKGKMEIVQTIAGLPKTALIDFCREHNLDPFEFFAPGMFIPKCKNASVYNDEAHCDIIEDEQGHVEEMFELSSVGIFEVDFSMDLDEDYMKLIMAYAESNRRKTWREIVESRKENSNG